MRFLLFLGLLVFFFACKTDPASKLVEKDLMSNGIPIKIMTPPDPEVKVEDYGFVKDVTVKSGDDFYIQILESEATVYDPKSVKAEKLEETKNEPFFSKLILEEDQGFIFEKQIDESTINYDFRYIKIQGDKQYVFQRGLIGIFSKEAVENMYNAVKM